MGKTYIFKMAATAMLIMGLTHSQAHAIWAGLPANEPPPSTNTDFTGLPPVSGSDQDSSNYNFNWQSYANVPPPAASGPTPGATSQEISNYPIWDMGSTTADENPAFSETTSLVRPTMNENSATSGYESITGSDSLLATNTATPANQTSQGLNGTDASGSSAVTGSGAVEDSGTDYRGVETEAKSFTNAFRNK